MPSAPSLPAQPATTRLRTKTGLYDAKKDEAVRPSTLPDHLPRSSLWPRERLFTYYPYYRLNRAQQEGQHELDVSSAPSTGVHRTLSRAKLVITFPHVLAE